MAKYLNLDGLQTFWTKIKNHVITKISELDGTVSGTPGTKTPKGYCRSSAGCRGWMKPDRRRASHTWGWACCS